MQRALLLAGLFAFSSSAIAVAIPVELQKHEDGWQLLRAGKPYFIRGAGGSASLAALKAAGANSIRTWGDDATPELLDEAHALGLTVTVGIWLGHERHGFDYADRAQLEQQLKAVREKVLRFKDHPAVLLWGVGNETEGFAEGDNPLIWRAVNEVAAMVKELDPHHPTMTVTAFVHGQRIEYVHRQSPAIDIHGIISFGGGNRVLLDYLRSGNASKPFVLAEFGPVGPWEVPRTFWGGLHEQTSTAKAATYRQSYQQAVLAAPGMALGAYAFLWGQKMEATETWFGMFVDDGVRLAAVDTMTELWSGRVPGNLAPTVEPLGMAFDAAVEPGTEIKVSALARDPEGAELRSRWQLKRDFGEIFTLGAFRATPRPIDAAIIESGLTGATVRMPDEPGAYRLFYWVYDEAGNAATANIPLLVYGQDKSVMPFPPYRRRFENMPWLPSDLPRGVDESDVNGDHAAQVN